MAEFDLARSALSRQPFLHEAREGRSRRHIKEAESILLFFKKIEEQDSLQKRSVGVYNAAQPECDCPHKYLLTSEIRPKCLGTTCH